MGHVKCLRGLNNECMNVAFKCCTKSKVKKKYVTGNYTYYL